MNTMNTPLPTNKVIFDVDLDEEDDAEDAYEKLMEEYNQLDEDDGYSTDESATDENEPNQEECNAISAHLARLERELKNRVDTQIRINNNKHVIN